MISIVCVYNNERILKDNLLESLKHQKSKIELIKLNNTQNVFKSAAEALNYAGSKAEGEFIIFVHQDVKLIGINWLEKVEKYLQLIKDLGIAGIAGMSNFENANGMRERNIIFHGINKKAWGYEINEPTEVQTLDEQLLIIPKVIFNILKFDEVSCSGWHLYGVDYSLSVRKLGLKPYVIPLKVWHKSTGITPDWHYFRTLKKIAKKHNHIKMIYTTSGYWPNTKLFMHLAILKKILKDSHIG